MFCFKYARGIPNRAWRLQSEIECRPKHVKLLKVDVEGSEVEAFRGACNTLKITEYVVFEAAKQTIKECMKILHSVGFETVNVVEEGPLGTCNFIAVKRR